MRRALVVVWTVAAIFGGVAVGVAVGLDLLALRTDEQRPTMPQEPQQRTEPSTGADDDGVPRASVTPMSEPEIPATVRPPTQDADLAAEIEAAERRITDTLARQQAEEEARRRAEEEAAEGRALAEPESQPTAGPCPDSSVHPSVAAESLERMERIVAAREATFPWVRVAWEASCVVPFDETLNDPCSGSGRREVPGCMIYGGGRSQPEVWISLETIRDEPPSDFDLLWGSPKRSLERLLLHELAHVLDLTKVGNAIDRGDAFRAAARGFRDHYAGCHYGGFDSEHSAHELLADTNAELTAGHSLGRWTELDGCLATLPPPEEIIDDLGFALAGCGSVGSLDDLGRDRTQKWCPDEFAALETERQEMATAEAKTRAAAEAQRLAESEAEAERLAAEAAAEAERLAAEAAAEAERALAVECRDDRYRGEGPGWESGCEEAGHIPDEVPCVVWHSHRWLPGYFDDRNDWLPEYFSGDGECRINVGLTSAPRAWRDCLPDDGGRWSGDWAADPYNSRYPCQRTLAAECANDVNRSPRLPQMHWRDTDGNRWPPGWEQGCKEAGHIPDGVPCVVSARHESQRDLMARHGLRGMGGWLPGQPDGSGGCTANTALFRADNPQIGLREWLACLPDDEGRWTGDWTADPINGRDTCPAG
ncbi:MAG: hypothetical protein F4Z34_00490 [Acidimicrobiaceae bacterium]|nr:hypothetical protein [Acidimicrobiaceae bacterium]